MKVYVIAGEASGDLHGAALIRELKKKIPTLNVRAWGGDLMEKEGAHLVKHYRELAFMGFTEVILNLKTILNNIRNCKEDIDAFKPDAIVLIDYPGFNLRIAEFAHERGYKVFYYISPQVWAWKSSRVEKIKRVVDKMFVILPFEKEFYKKFGVDVDYVGHPLPDVIKEKRISLPSRKDFLDQHRLDDRPVIALLPGSRRQEITEMLPLMISVVAQFPGYQFVIAAAPSQPMSFYKSMINAEKIPIVENATYELLQHSEAALVTSGTATLETALMNVPEVVCYKGGRISYLIARSLIKIKFISLVNLIMDREVVKELIQQDLNTKSITRELKKILDPLQRIKIFEDYELLNEKLQAGGAATRTASLIAAAL